MKTGEKMPLKPNVESMPKYHPGRKVGQAKKLSSNENPLGPSKLALKVLRETLGEIHRYPDMACTLLRRKLAERWRTEETGIIVANGSDEIFSLICAAFLPVGHNALTALETFSQYRYSVQLFDGLIREVPLEHGYYNLNNILNQIDRSTRLVFLCNPNNPTGTYRSHQEIFDFLEALPQQVLVVMDEAYADFADADDFPDSRQLLAGHRNLIISRTFSKIYGLAGLRVGYCVADPAIIDGLERASPPFNVNSLAQAAAATALEDYAHHEKSRKLVFQGKEFLYKACQDTGIAYYPTQGNFLCLQFGVETAEIWPQIVSRGIVIRDLASFRLPQMGRYTIGEADDNSLFMDILREILPAIERKIPDHQNPDPRIGTEFHPSEGLQG